MQVLGWLRLGELLLALLLLGSCCALPKDATDASRQQALETQSTRSIRSITDTHKRHSEGTFTSDFTHYLDKMKAKDFVHWLINTKRYSSTKRDLQEDARGLRFPGSW
ncbi:glucagon-1-like [Nothoprocta perdicaria]|uniref:glucagon-1-like n=1 Tax=Nothoprocta perdicaria TaxID=30464 RepID=UPI000E1BD95A|nr:glucagon-1-like [Nothoprocta perdicaria]